MLEINMIVKITNTDDDESFKHYHKDRIGYIYSIDIHDSKIYVAFLDIDLLNGLTESISDYAYWGNASDVFVIGKMI